jgi:hypothetical protein
VLITELLSAENDAIVYSSFELLATPAAMMSALPKAAVTASVGAPRAAGKGQIVPITVEADGAALFVGLTTAAHGRFSRNFFVMAKGKLEILFIPFGALDVATLNATLRVEHVRSHL